MDGAGVVGSGDFLATQAGTPNMSVNIATGQVWIPGTLASTSGFGLNINAQTTYGLPTTLNEQGSYYAWNNGTVNLAIATSNPSNPRIDIVCASIQDAAYSGSNNQAVLQVITGTPAASPAVPAAPASSVVICQILVGTGVTSILNANITDVRPFQIGSQSVTGQLIGRVAGPGGTVDTVNTTATLVTLTVPLLAGAKYLLFAHSLGGMVTAATNTFSDGVADTGALILGGTIYQIYNPLGGAINSQWPGSTTTLLQPGANVSDVFTMTASSTTGAGGSWRHLANSCEMIVVRVA